MRHSARRRGSHRRWPRRVLIFVNIVVASCLVLVGGAYAYVRYRLDSIRTVAAPHLTPVDPKAPDRAAGLPSENILLIGNETRSGLTNSNEIAALGSPETYSGSLSDVIMILHLDPVKGQASILSIPRDLFVPMPAGSPVGAYQKIDAALNDGKNGPDNLIEAITNDLGIPINHYVELEFDGFENTVNALGGINVDFPEKVVDANSLLNITRTGCQHINGTQALALVRARHLQYDPPGDAAPPADWPYDPESDLSRILRDHTFLRILATTAESQGLGDPLKLNAFLGAVINQITIDPGLKSQLIPLMTHFRHLNPSAVPQLTLPITTLGGPTGYHYGDAAVGDVDFPVEPNDQEVINQWAGAPATTAAPKAVTVFNLAGSYNLAARTAAALSADGLPATVGGDLPTPASTTETWVRYGTGGLAMAQSVASHLSGAIMLESDSSVPAGQVAVDAGSLLAVSAPATQSTPSTTQPGTSSSTQPASSSTQPAPSSTQPGTSSTTVAGGSAGTAAYVPTPGGETPSASGDQPEPWDPMPCPA